jgi:hypothetical protein
MVMNTCDVVEVGVRSEMPALFLQNLGRVS